MEKDLEDFIGAGKQAVVDEWAKRPFRRLPGFEDMLAGFEAMMRHMATQAPDPVDVSVKASDYKPTVVSMKTDDDTGKNKGKQ